MTQDLYASTPLASSTLPASSLAQLGHPVETESASKNAHILLPRPSDDEIAGYFALIHPLKYTQEHQPVSSSNTAPLEGLTITAYAAGHTVGGAIWHIRYGSESVVYAVDWSQGRENVMSGAGWLGGGATSGSEVIEQLRQPTALICSSKDSQKVSMSGGWRVRDEQLLGHVSTAIQRNATVLLPCDTSARVLELAFLFERSWAENSQLRNAKLFLASHTCDATMKYARSMLEWMDENVVRDFENQATAPRTGTNSASKETRPFDFKHLKLLERQSQVERALTSPGPKVFLASGENLEWGFSRDVFVRTHADPNNLIVIPIKPEPHGTTAAVDDQVSVLDWLASKAAEESTVVQLDNQLDWKEPQITSLGVDELAVYQQFMTRQRQQLDAASLQTGSALEAPADAAEENSASSSSSSEDSDDEHQGKVLNTSNTMQHSKRKFAVTDEELGINVLLRRKDAHDFDVRGKKGRERFVPYIARRKRNDEFGDVIRPEDYLRAEERDDIDHQFNVEDSKKENFKIGQKRRLDGKEASRGDNSADARANNKRRKNTGEHDNSNRKGEANHANPGAENADEVESEESDYEPAEPIVLGPQKISFSSRRLHVRVRAVAVDYAGIHDKRGLQMLLLLIRPRKLILTAGSAEDSQLMERDCTRVLGGPTTKEGAPRSTTIYKAKDGEAIDASVDTNSWSISLSRSLLRGLRWQKYRQLGVVTIDGQVQESLSEDEPLGSSAKRPKLEDDSNAEEKDLQIGFQRGGTITIPILNSLPSSSISTNQSFTQTNHVGDLRLAELRKILQDRGHVAQFKGEGTLLVDDHIAVRKNGTGKIEIESGGGFANTGSFGTGLYTVKQKIYEGLATVAAR